VKKLTQSLSFYALVYPIKLSLQNKPDRGLFANMVP